MEKLQLKTQNKVYFSLLFNILIIVFSFSLIIFSFPVYAQLLDLSVTPPQIQILTKSDKTLIQGFTFVNQGDEGVFRVQVVSFEPTANGGRVLKDKPEGPIRFTLANPDITMNKPFVLGSKKAMQVLLSIRITPGAPEGDYYYSVMLVSQPNVSQQSSGRAIGALSANLLITVTNDGFLDNQIKVAQFQVVADYQFNLFGTTYTILTQAHAIPVVFSIANIGKNLFSPIVQLKLQGPFGLDRTSDMIPVFVLAHTQRQLQTEDITCATCTTDPSVVFRGSGWGKYVARAEITIEGSDKKLYAQTQFWVLPVRLIVYVVGGTLIGLIILVILKMLRK